MNRGPLARGVPVRFDVDGPVATVTLDRPESLNAITPEMHRELLDAWHRFSDDDALRVAILAGAGERAFCAGIDVNRMDEFYAVAKGESRVARWSREPGIGGLTRNLDVGKPVLAAVHGYCLGIGLELALACDLRIASEDAMFGFPEVKLGIIPGQGGTQRLVRTVPPGIAQEMILTGTPMNAQRALAVGLVNRVVPHAELRAATAQLAQEIAAQPPRAVRTAREAIRRGAGVPFEDALRIELELADPLRGSEENLRAREAFRRRSAR